MKLHKKTLLLAGSISLALGLGVSSHVIAQTMQADPLPAVSTLNNDTPQGKLQAAPSLQQDFSAKNTPALTRHKIEYMDYKSYAELLNLFPGARQIIEDYGQKPKTPDDFIVRSSGTFGKATDNLYIFQSTASEDCGIRGCTTVVFSVGETGFYPSAFILTAMSPPEYEIDKYGEPSIFTCTVDLEWIEWKRRDSMDMTGEPVANEDCKRFMSVYNEPTP